MKNLSTALLTLLKFREPTLKDRHHKTLKPISIKKKGENVALVRV